MISHQAIERFARETLGCHCPAEVFQQINCQDKASLDKDSLRSLRINIGGRLLIYVAECLDIKVLASVVQHQAAQGKQERDSLGFNRFRLVITTDKPDAIAEQAQAVFSGLNPDEKLHLHVIDRSDFPG
jgi:hypothetical protein